MSKKKFRLQSEVWLYPGMAGWHFLSIPKKQSEEINTKFRGMKRGWGSLPAVVTIKKTSWKTSIFPDKKSGTYLLPLKPWYVRRRAYSHKIRFHLLSRYKSNPERCLFEG